MLADLLFFLFGVHLMIMLLAALYRIVDLWYRIAEYWQRITVRIALLWTLDAGLILLLPDTGSAAFVSGQLAYLLFHVVTFCLTRIAALILTHRR